MKHFALKSIFLSLVLSLTALPSVAQSIQKLTIKVPKVTRFLQIKNEGVNLRRLPNTTSGKLMIWNSDGGSIDTYSKLFYSDTEATRFRPNRNTGAYIEAYHPQKGEVMILNPQKSEAQNGWYQLQITAPDYAGNPGQANTKLAWVRGDFCKVVDKVEPNDDQLGDLEVLIPACDVEGTKQLDFHIKNCSVRNGGAYNNVWYEVNSLNEDEIYFVQFVYAADFVYIANARIPIEYDAEQNEKVCLKTVVEENDMGDAEDYEYLKAFVKMPRGMNSFQAVVNYINTCPDEVFGQIISTLTPNGVMPADQVYFIGNDGRSYKVDFESNVASSIAYDTYYYPLHRQQ
jgi:hypothetical protein